jgi:hypothetical protein
MEMTLMKTLYTLFNSMPADNRPFTLHKIITKLNLRNDCKPYSTWDDSKTEEYTKIADEMLERFNPNSRDNQWFGNPIDGVPFTVHRCVSSYGDDNRGLIDGVGAAITEGAKGND